MSAIEPRPAVTPKLNPQQWRKLKEIVDNLDRIAPGGVSEDNRRRAKRCAFPVAVTLSWKDYQGAEHSTIAVARNISTSGMGLVVRQMFRSSDAVTIELPNPGGGTRQLDAQVTFCRYIGEAYHEIGLRFVQPAKPERP